MALEGLSQRQNLGGSPRLLSTHGQRPQIAREPSQILGEPS